MGQNNSKTDEERFAPFEAKMAAEKLSPAAILAFKNSYLALVRGESGMIPEDTIKPVIGIPSLDADVKGSISADAELLKSTVVLKLNGGLGTGMGLNQAKSLLKVKDGLTFLDLMAMQIVSLRKTTGQDVRFMLMNSFSTSKDTLDFLAKYPEFENDDTLELMQNKVPKINQETMEPVSWSKDPENEWCPPGHGDLYAALYGSGRLQELLDAGVIYMFVSNSDNLGATLDLELLTWFAQSQKPFLMEVCDRTAADKKGGHLASRKSDGQLVLRESAMCRDEDESFFQDINRHAYFNTNNLWIRLDLLKEELEKNNGIIPLPMIRNSKTVDPKDSSSTKVYQLETAMGAAIECFAGAGAIVVPRSRFAPVKKTNDLFLLRSDAYEIQDDNTLQLAPELNGVPPTINLDQKLYKFVDDLEELTADGVPSMKRSTSLTVIGKVEFNSLAKVEGNVVLRNSSNNLAKLADVGYADGDFEVGDAPADPEGLSF
mmetsp:Transcript_23026/g.33408  ORF Transcript_23026/g.33408 Transcript_23026/m.33408 type:complete len:488 (-) Transcript_23026:293-1756(-)|eukprot:CAMPEP_0113933592 /NCGR_PEP_ID=MMETSP1339-20121228/727_1 /TAXON_ID=94617 /ORGANISM="Fibrocapsa japonica" /LENGTH=487 /DNA_ID=CAMNT_0000934929 /DNA_START=90 /DNA_END=1553 /DNA_ORIENTATION=+ /assembly_acc=CAM_ASM_000762